LGDGGAVLALVMVIFVGPPFCFFFTTLIFFLDLPCLSTDLGPDFDLDAELERDLDGDGDGDGDDDDEDEDEDDSDLARLVRLFLFVWVRSRSLPRRGDVSMGTDSRERFS
jgi:hypothetical protein